MEVSYKSGQLIIHPSRLRWENPHGFWVFSCLKKVAEFYDLWYNERTYSWVFRSSHHWGAPPCSHMLGSLPIALGSPFPACYCSSDSNPLVQVPWISCLVGIPALQPVHAYTYVYIYILYIQYVYMIIKTCFIYTYVYSYSYIYIYIYTWIHGYVYNLICFFPQTQLTHIKVGKSTRIMGWLYNIFYAYSLSVS